MDVRILCVIFMLTCLTYGEDDDEIQTFKAEDAFDHSSDLVPDSNDRKYDIEMEVIPNTVNREQRREEKDDRDHREEETHELNSVDESPPTESIRDNPTEAGGTSEEDDQPLEAETTGGGDHQTDNIQTETDTEAAETGDVFEEGSARQKNSLISYQTFLTWFLEKIRPESERDVEESPPAVDTAAAPAAAVASDNGTATEEAKDSTMPTLPPTPADGVAEGNGTATEKCIGFGCILNMKLKEKQKSIKCTPRNMTVLETKREGTTLDDLTRVHIFMTQGRINDALKNRKSEQGDCILLLVFSPHCRFSVRIAPFVNALARAFPLLEVGAIDATLHRSVAHKFGVAGVPSLVLFQNNKMVAKLNDTEGIDVDDFEKLTLSVASMTGLTVNESVVIEDFDYEGPLKSILVEQTDVYLVLSWVFLIFFGIQKFLRSDYGRSIRQSLLLHLTIWQEVAENEPNNDHPHAD